MNPKGRVLLCGGRQRQAGREHPAAAAKVTRAMLKAARWVEENPTTAAELAVEKKYIAASAEINAQAISKLTYLPGVSQCKKSVEDAAREMKQAGLLKDGTDPEVRPVARGKISTGSTMTG